MEPEEPEIKINSETEPQEFNFGEDVKDYYIVEIQRSVGNDLTIEVRRERPSGTATLLEATIIETPSEVETLSKLILEVSTGDISELDQAMIIFVTRLTDEEQENLADYPKGIDLGEGQTQFRLRKKYNKETVLAALKELKFKTDLKALKPEAIVESAYKDIEAAALGVVAPVNAMMPEKYHEKHIEIENQVFTEEVERLYAARVNVPSYEYKPLVAAHIQGHKTAIHRRLWEKV